MSLFGRRKKEQKEEVKQSIQEQKITKDDGWITIEGDDHFFGQYNESENGKFLVAFQDGHIDATSGKSRWINGEVYLINDRQNILWKKQIERPNNAHVSNDGTVAVEDWLNSKELCGVLRVFDVSGNQLMEKRLDSNIGTSNISPDGKYAVVTTCNPDNSIYLFDTRSGKLLWKYKNHSDKIALNVFFNGNKVAIGTGKSVVSAEAEYELTLDGDLSKDSKKDLDVQKSLEEGEMKSDEIVKLLKSHLSSNKKSEIRKGLEEIKKILYLKNQGKKKREILKSYLDEFSKITPFLIILLERSESDLQTEGLDILVKLGKIKKELITEHKDKIIDYIKKNSKNFRESHLLGHLGELDPEFSDVILPILKNNLVNSKYWNSRRFAIFNLESIGKKYPDKIKDVIPIIVEYIEKPEKKDKEIRELAKNNDIAQIDIAVAEGMGADPKTWIMDAA
ncbi:hypothetical protein DRJ25_05860, partial [Candidatus Woesearchaeota archaeon]